MEELVKLLEEVQVEWGLETVKAVLKKIDSYPIKDKGVLRRSISFEQKDDGIVFNMADYGEFIDQGVDGLVRPVGSKFKFRGNWKAMAPKLKQWSNSKGLNEWAVAWNIQQRGIKPRPFFESIIEKRVPTLGEAILKAQADYLDKQINNINRE